MQPAHVKAVVVTHNRVALLAEVLAGLQAQTVSLERIVVVEPLPEGSFFSVLLPVEDETQVRVAAQEVLRRSIEDGTFELFRRLDYPRIESFESLDGFLARVVAVDPARAAAVAERRSEVEEAFRRHGRPAPDGRFTLEQPMRAYILDTDA